MKVSAADVLGGGAFANKVQSLSLRRAGGRRLEVPRRF
jgi:hypothetical protein